MRFFLQGQLIALIVMATIAGIACGGWWVLPWFPVALMLLARAALTSVSRVAEKGRDALWFSGAASAAVAASLMVGIIWDLTALLLAIPFIGMFWAVARDIRTSRKAKEKARLAAVERRDAGEERDPRNQMSLDCHNEISPDVSLVEMVRGGFDHPSLKRGKKFAPACQLCVAGFVVYAVTSGDWSAIAGIPLTIVALGGLFVAVWEAIALGRTLGRKAAEVVESTPCLVRRVVVGVAIVGVAIAIG